MYHLCYTNKEKCFFAEVTLTLCRCMNVLFSGLCEKNPFTYEEILQHLFHKYNIIFCNFGKLYYNKQRIALSKLRTIAYFFFYIYSLTYPS